MVYILSGVAKAGKTLLSNEILKRFNISVFSTDYIMMMLYKGNKDLNIDTYASDSSVAEKIEPYVYGMIETMVENDATYLIEGVHFNTTFAKKLHDTFGDKVKIIYIGYKDIEVTDKVSELFEHRNEIDNPWIFNHRGEKVEDIVKYLIIESERIYNECQRFALPYIEINNIVHQLDGILESFIEESDK